MLHETEFYKAHHYFLVPMKELSKDNGVDNKEGDSLLNEMESDAVLVGGQGVMIQLAKYLEDDQILFEMGLAGLRCMLGIDLDAESCVKLIKLATEDFDRSLIL